MTRILFASILVAGLVGSALAGPAERAYRKGDLTTARRLYEEQLREKPGDSKARYNLGNVLYRSEELKAAEEAYRASLGSPDPTVRARAAHNLGNARLKLGRIDDAVAAYVDALRAQPENPDSKYNLELALKLREMQKQQQQEQQQRQKEDPQQQQHPQEGEQKEKEQGEEQKKAEGQEERKEDQQATQAQGEGSKEQTGQQETQERPAGPSDYTKEQAERILDGLEQEERDLMADRLRAQGQEARAEKDW